MSDVIIYVEEDPKDGYIANILNGNYHIGGYQEYIKNGEFKSFVSNGAVMNMRVAGDVKNDILKLRDNLYADYEKFKSKRPIKARLIINSINKYDAAIIDFIDKVDDFKKKNPEGWDTL